MATSAPTEFRYAERLGDPWVRRFRALSRALTGVDPAPSPDVVDMLASMYFDADPLAEAFVREAYLGRGPDEGRALLERALADGVSTIDDAPESLRRLFEDLDQEPSWVDWDRIECGARVFRRWGTSVFRFAGVITLAAYRESSVAKPLALTGAYSGASTKHRFLETAAFWIAVSEPGGLRPGAPGRASALRVRMMHVFVRERLLAHPDWDRPAWGVPISQADALLTLMGGSVAPGLGLMAMGYRPSRRDIEDSMLFWRYVGHLMGVRPRWYPCSIAEALQLAFVTHLKRAETAGEDGIQLCQSFIEAFAPEPSPSKLARWRDHLSHGVHRGFTRFFLPPPLYHHNRLPPVGLWALFPLACFPFIFTAETLRRWFPPLDDVADHLVRARRRRWLARHSGGRPPEYRPVDPMRGRVQASIPDGVRGYDDA